MCLVTTPLTKHQNAESEHQSIETRAKTGRRRCEIGSRGCLVLERMNADTNAEMNAKISFNSRPMSACTLCCELYKPSKKEQGDKHQCAAVKHQSVSKRAKTSRIHEKRKEGRMQAKGHAK